MASLLYNNWKKKLLEGAIDHTSGLKVMLVSSAYTPNADTHDFINDVSANEITGTGYSAGGAAIDSESVTIDTANDRAVLDASDVEWANSTITARGAVVYKDTGDASTSPVIAYIDFGEDKVSVAALFKIAWNALGILYIG